ncbi:hypothetical protein TNCV_184971 [Trichonephila clavipes]|nr:hypothetical protein TNCV_184971 [Trichonephila clavipes]
MALSGSLPQINLGVQGETQGGLHRTTNIEEIVLDLEQNNPNIKLSVMSRRKQRTAFDHVSEFDRGRIMAYRDTVDYLSGKPVVLLDETK